MRSERSVNMGQTMRPVTIPRQTIRQELPPPPSAPLREAHAFFCALTAGLSTRLPLRNVENMRRGTARSAPVADVELLVAMRRASLPRECALRYAAFLRAQVDALFPADRSSLSARRQRVLALEGAEVARQMAAAEADRAESLTAEAETALRAQARCKEAEIAAEMEELGAIYQRLQGVR
jgi:hypothetical protein